VHGGGYDWLQLSSSGGKPLLIDRAFVAVHPNGENCLVLAQDKVNRTTFTKAITDLNEAATLLSANTGIHDVLVVVTVIGASDRTKSQIRLKFPHILVRSIEVDDFYSVNFAPLVRYARKRACLSTGVLADTL
jgi:mRNA-degrading endonuclease HigB of HigAB toxin-antitoxin module